MKHLTRVTFMIAAILLIRFSLQGPTYAYPWDNVWCNSDWTATGWSGEYCSNQPCDAQCFCTDEAQGWTNLCGELCGICGGPKIGMLSCDFYYQQAVYPCASNQWYQYFTLTCQCAMTVCQPAPGQCIREDQEWNYETCQCDTVCPVLFDRNGDGLALTSANAGVPFDLSPGGPAEFLSWTAPGSDDAFLALDRNGNGIIDNGLELFSSYALQDDSIPDTPNGFRALALFDHAENGGNGDGEISAADTIYPSLLLWTDVNHNGISEASELGPLTESGMTSIDLDYRDGRRHDEHGNLLRWRTKTKGVQGKSRVLWDVILRLRQ